jgi:hypothetical protein
MKSEKSRIVIVFRTRIRIQSGQWIQEGKNDPQNYKKANFGSRFDPVSVISVDSDPGGPK